MAKRSKAPKSSPRSNPADIPIRVKILTPTLRTLGISVRSRVPYAGESITVRQSGKVYHPTVSHVNHLPASSKCAAEVTVPSLGTPERPKQSKRRTAASKTGLTEALLAAVVLGAAVVVLLLLM
ncbi:MAG: hypothetical protein AAF289_20090 [Cyanobacteria bacterium P01_A01_bin.135]